MRGIAGTERHTQAHARGQWTITKARCLIRSRAGGRVESSDSRELGNMINDGAGSDNTYVATFGLSVSWVLVVFGGGVCVKRSIPWCEESPAISITKHTKETPTIK
jgi:hypothetical protein